MKHKLFVVSDIHGHYQELIKALESSGFSETNASHILIILGDMFDRGSENVEVYQYLKGLNDTYGNDRIIILSGNHELFLTDLFLEDARRIHFNYLYNGFDKTISSFTHLDRLELKKYTNKEIRDLIEVNYPEFLSWVTTLPFYYETKNYLFTHAGLDPTIEVSDNDWKVCVWIESEIFENINLKDHGFEKILVMGHRPTIILGEKNYDIHYAKDGQKIYIDGGVAYNGKINVLVVEDEIY